MGSCVAIYAQTASNLRFKTFSIEADTIFIDSNSIVQNAFKLLTEDDSVIDTSYYALLPWAGKLIWKKKPNVPIVKAWYRVYPTNFTTHFFHKPHENYLAVKDNFSMETMTYMPESAAPFSLIDFGDLDYSGNFSRGFSFGNNQSVSLNSNFNLQLQGNLTKDLEILAAITDNNIPIQPEGNTQQIQEFDKIFVQLKKGDHQVTVGDFDLYNPPGYFMRYSKKAQGGLYNGLITTKKAGTLKAGFGGGISKGKFARNTLKVSEGNQGPYKLTGSNGETFIIIIANSEEIFINGEKLVRGADRDYVIDYNIGTVIFTPKRIITKDLRVVVEFEYSEQNYQRTLFSTDLQYDYKKLSTYFHLYTEQDSKNQSVQQSLNQDKKNFLINSGDSVNYLYYKGYDTASYDAYRVLYEKIDTFFVYNNDTLFKSIFVQTGNRNVQLYAVNFTYIGEGQGEYVAASTTTNGRSYAYVAPTYDVTKNSWNDKRGAYLPVIRLVAPRLQQLYTFGTKYQINERQNISAEGALSNTDLNTFSKVDDKDNLGGAAQISYKAVLPIKKDSSQIIKQLKLDVNYEFVDKKFNVIERYRNIEFSRDFNIQTITKHTEHLAFIATEYWDKKWGTTGYRFRTFIQDTAYKGFENLFYNTFYYKGFTFSTNTSLVNSESKTQKAIFLRPRVNMNYVIPKTKGWQLAVTAYLELNQVTNIATQRFDSTLSHWWQNYTFGIHSPDSMQNKYAIDYTFRAEHAPENLHFDKANFKGHTININGQINTIKRQTLSWTLTYRRVDYSDSTRQKNELKNYYLGRIDYAITAWKGLLRYNTFYEIGAGREQKTQLFFLVSPTNTGDYVYQGDLNHNGIKDITEFQQTQFVTGNDTTYIKTYSVTNDFFPVNSVQFNQSLQLYPAAKIKSTKGILKFIGRFSMMSALLVSKKVYASNGTKVGQLFNPFPEQKYDSNLVAINLSNRNSIFFNRTSPIFSAELNINFSQNKILLTSGFEIKKNSQQSLVSRWNIYKGLSWNSTLTNGIKSNTSDFFQKQQYTIRYQETAQELTYTLKDYLRFGVNYSFAYKQNKKDTLGGQRAVVNQLTYTTKFTRTDKTIIEVGFTYAAVNYKVPSGENIQAQYAMLEGLLGGSNYIWSASVEQRLMNGVQLLIGYDGRKIGDAKIIHSGRAEIRALF